MVLCCLCKKIFKNTISVAGNSAKPLSSLSTTKPDLKLTISHLDNLRMEQTKLDDLINEQNEKLNSFDKKFHGSSLNYHISKMKIVFFVMI
jgi:hypothetical protein